MNFITVQYTSLVYKLTRPRIPPAPWKSQPVPKVAQATLERMTRTWGGRPKMSFYAVLGTSAGEVRARLALLGRKAPNRFR